MKKKNNKKTGMIFGHFAKRYFVAVAIVNVKDVF